MIKETTTLMICDLRFSIVIEYLIFLRESSCSSWFIPYLKKQSQFGGSQNDRKVNYNKEIRGIYWIGYLVKTKPNKANFGVRQK